MTPVIDYLENRTTAFHIGLNCVLVLILGIIDFSTVHEISFGLFYLIPVSLVAWFLTSSTRVITWFIIALVWLIGDVKAGPMSNNQLPSYWNAIGGFVFLGVVALVLSALRGAYQHEKDLARTDPVTEALNARALYELTHREIVRARRYDHPLTLAYMDIDNFKAVNDKYGHVVGDQLLKTVTDVARSSLRETDSVARIGGDEFAILLPETGNEVAQIVINKVQRTLLEEMEKYGWSVTFSIGVVTCLSAPAAVTDVVQWGDDLVYAAKNSGKNTVRYNIVAAESAALEQSH
ncbi:MAG: GGDEF domain-containing protein [Pyrinomonadaceae bacterium]